MNEDILLAATLGVSVDELGAESTRSDIQSLGDSDLPELSEDGIDEGEYGPLVIRSIDIRRPVYEGIWLYFYVGCNGGFSRIRRSRVYWIVATGMCGRVRRFKLFYIF